MTNAEIWKEQREALRKFLAGLDRGQLLEARQDVDWALGYKEFIEKIRAEGIVL